MTGSIRILPPQAVRAGTAAGSLRSRSAICRGARCFRRLEHRLENAVRSQHQPAELLDALTTVRYPRARMRRLAMDAALGYTADIPALPPYLHLLGAARSPAPAGAGALPVSHSLARLAENAACARMAAAQAAASDFGRCAGQNRSRWAEYIVKKLSF